mgnify:CR=1 FL=1
MKLVFLTGDECDVCHELEVKFKEKFKAELDSGEAMFLNLDQDTEAQDWWIENELPVAPAMVVATEEGRVVAVLKAEEL